MARSRSPRRARDVRIRRSNKREEERRDRRGEEKAATMTPPPVESLSRLFALQSVEELPRGGRGEEGHGDGDGGGGGEKRPSVTPAADPMMPGRVSPPPRRPGAKWPVFLVNRLVTNHPIRLSQY